MHAAFEMAKLREAALGRPSRVTIVHKANVLSVTDGLFRQCALEVAKDPAFAGVKVEEQLVDSMVYALSLLGQGGCFTRSTSSSLWLSLSSK